MALARKLTERIYEIKAHNGNVTCLDVGETGRVLVTGGQDRNVNLWAIGQTECFMSLTGHNRPIDCVRFAYNDDFVYSADDIGIIRRWDLNAQTICSTLNGHMKSVRTLDFNPSGEYVVSGSNDTTVRLWDVRNQNSCMKIYRGHISHVNSVKFSPDGLWIASAGTEGSVIIWDIRKSKQIMEFCDQPAGAAITCIQFHPFEFLLAVGRVDGTVCIYDLETKSRITQTDSTSLFYRHPIKCITFSENGECLFVGTAAAISVIGWEPDREFDHIKSAWTALGDMKIVNRRLICGSFEQEYVSIDALSVNRVFPFYNPSNNTAPAFNHNSTTRKSFSRGNQKLRLSIGGTKPSRLVEENEDNRSPSLDGHSSPNLSLELVDESAIDPAMQTPTLPSVSTHPLNGHGGNSINITLTDFETSYTSMGGSSGGVNVPLKKLSSSPYHFPTIASSTAYSSFGGSSLGALNFDGPSSLKMPGERGDIYQYERFVDPFNQDSEINFNESFPPVITNYDNTEMVEDFPVNTNLHQPPGSTGPINGTSNSVSSTTSSSNFAHPPPKTAKPKTTSHITKRTTQVTSGGGGVKNSVSSTFQQRNKLSQVSSVSTTELHKMDDNMLIKKSASSHIVVNKNKAHVNKENARNKNITVQIITKPPTRSRTSLELRSPQKQAQQSAAQRQTQRLSSYNMDTSNGSANIPISYRPDPSLLSQSGVNQKSFNNSRHGIDDNVPEIEMLSATHEQVYQELSNRNATLQIIRNSTRSHDVLAALRQAIKMGRTVFVDLLGAILEKTSSWNLDLCILILPEIYELLQSQHKFHYTRACDTLRVILSNFLPIIQDNLDPWVNGLGVDVTREERHRKCLECQRWLLQIRNLPESNHFGTTLSQLQNMIVNI
ncbi:katanin p80 WD40 repeat-containing subunit B1 isoform X1 [Lucilia cuprina]|uniref:katanin p80 WD40 repeat-containing subunit B1 isoform X1 n=1 Tax=Lucilia cuprina TaxID=7375 RepID=UPI001F067041|nr:katanin p80 WD40 repeat-containing subunit B1 isoform X1 [Lucilia cuprina]